MLAELHVSTRLTVPNNVVKQIAEGRPMMLALICGGLRTQYAAVADDLCFEALKHAADACFEVSATSGVQADPKPTISRSSAMAIGLLVPFCWLSSNCSFPDRAPACEG